MRYGNQVVGGATGAIGGNIAGRLIAKRLNQKYNKRVPGATDRAQKEAQEIKSVRDKIYRLKLKGGLTPADIEKIKDLKRTIGRLKNNPTYTDAQQARIQTLQVRLQQLETAKLASDNAAMRSGNQNINMQLATDTLTDVARQEIEGQMNVIKEQGLAASRKKAQTYIKQRDQLKNKMNLTHEQAMEYKKLKERVRRGNASQRELDQLERTMRSNRNWSNGIGTVAGAGLGVGVGALVSKRAKNKNYSEEQVEDQYVEPVGLTMGLVSANIKLKRAGIKKRIRELNDKRIAGIITQGELYELGQLRSIGNKEKFIGAAAGGTLTIPGALGYAALRKKDRLREKAHMAKMMGDRM